MNVLIVTGIFPPDRGGPASYVPKMAAALGNRGHRVQVVCLSDRLDCDDSEFPFAIHRIRRRTFWPLRVLLTAFRIWRLARHSDLVFVNGLGAESALAAALAGRPAVHKIVGDYAWERAVGRSWFRGTLDGYQHARKGLRLRLLDAIRTLPLVPARAVITPSEYLHRIVAGWGVPSRRILTIYNAAAAPEPVRRAPKALPVWKGTTLITVCRLVPWKGVGDLIELLADLPAARLVIAGDGVQRQDLAALARSRGVESRAVFLGDVPHAEVRDHLSQADAFVLNSTYEGMPHVVLEAMSAGIPVIATDAGGTREVVENEVTGLLVPAGERAALKQAILRLSHDHALGARLAAQAASRLAARFDFGRMVDATESVLRSAVAARSETPAGALSEVAP